MYEAGRERNIGTERGGLRRITSRLNLLSDFLPKNLDANLSRHDPEDGAGKEKTGNWKKQLRVTEHDTITARDPHPPTGPPPTQAARSGHNSPKVNLAPSGGRGYGQSQSSTLKRTLTNHCLVKSP
uniref:Uncharacterized protein n=1 Tax=Knipowitschia caucasica TaxID=637954 RepID=A0AAV2MA65_KNICA